MMRWRFRCSQETVGHLVRGLRTNGLTTDEHSVKRQGTDANAFEWSVLDHHPDASKHRQLVRPIGCAVVAGAADENHGLMLALRVLGLGQPCWNAELDLADDHVTFRDQLLDGFVVLPFPV